ncbi:MAG TPA: hypothetical protein VGD56_00370 [Gemmatirosa sp.]
MSFQPSAPPAPEAPVVSAQDRADFAQAAHDAAQAGRDAARLAAQATHEAVQGNANVGVVKDAGGRIVVTGPDGKTITIDPKAGLDGDQIQEMVQTALQPTVRDREDHGVPHGVVPVVAIVFTFLFLIALVISRAMSGRRAGGVVTAALPDEATARLARIEQAVEAVAIEVERISEAQRYSAQLLTDRLSGPAPTAPAVSAALRGDHG